MLLLALPSGVEGPAQDLEVPCNCQCLEPNSDRRLVQHTVSDVERLARLALGINVVCHGRVALDHDQRPTVSRQPNPITANSDGKTEETHPLGSDRKKSRRAPSVTKQLTLNQLVLRFSPLPELLATA